MAALAFEINWSKFNFATNIKKIFQTIQSYFFAVYYAAANFQFAIEAS